MWHCYSPSLSRGIHWDVVINLSLFLPPFLAKSEWVQKYLFAIHSKSTSKHQWRSCVTLCITASTRESSISNGNSDLARALVGRVPRHMTDTCILSYIILIVLSLLFWGRRLVMIIASMSLSALVTGGQLQLGVIALKPEILGSDGVKERKAWASFNLRGYVGLGFEEKVQQWGPGQDWGL